MYSSSQPHFLGVSGGVWLPGKNNPFGLNSLIVPLPCQADILYEQLNYICVNNEIKCLPGWKVSGHYWLVSKTNWLIIMVILVSQITTDNDYWE